MNALTSLDESIAERGPVVKNRASRSTACDEVGVEQNSKVSANRSEACARECDELARAFRRRELGQHGCAQRAE